MPANEGNDMQRTAFHRYASAVVTVLVLPVVAREYFSREAGREYGVGLLAKLRLLFIMIRNNFRVLSASNFLYHLMMAGKILRIPKDLDGVLVECGCYKGGSAVNLSHLASLCGRRLHLFDSFEGLPRPAEGDGEHLVLSELRVRTYDRGAYAGSLDEVKENLRRFGVLDACEFHRGYFKDTLPKFNEPVVFAYIDADLTESVKDCLVRLWPLLKQGCFLFTDEAHHNQVAGLFFDPSWWMTEMHSKPPGLVGAGNGLGLLLRPGGFGSSLGFTAKLDEQTLARLPG
jgi:O-methyltransferase